MYPTDLGWTTYLFVLRLPQMQCSLQCLDDGHFSLPYLLLGFPNLSFILVLFTENDPMATNEGRNSSMRKTRRNWGRIIHKWKTFILLGWRSCGVPLTNRAHQARTHRRQSSHLVATPPPTTWHQLQFQLPQRPRPHQ